MSAPLGRRPTRRLVRWSSSCSTRCLKASPLRCVLAGARYSSSSATACSRSFHLKTRHGIRPATGHLTRRDARYRSECCTGMAGKPAAAVDVALHLGEVLYGHDGAADRIDFTVIGPAVNEVAHIEALYEPLGHRCSSLHTSQAAAAVNSSAATICAGSVTARKSIG
jgi:hypothetical protein